MAKPKKVSKQKVTKMKATSKKTRQHKVKKRKSNTNPRRPKKTPKLLTRTPAKRQFYTVREDAIILQRLQNQKPLETISGITNEICKVLDRSFESVRDRIKRYINRLSPNDKKEVLRHLKDKKDTYIHFKKLEGAYKKIGTIDEEEPSIYNIRKFNQAQTNNKKKKNPKKKKEKNYGYKWLIQSLKSKDPYFQVDHGRIRIRRCKQIKDIEFSKQCRI